MKQPEHINSRLATDTEYDKMPALAPLSGDMNGHNAITEFTATFGTQYIRAICKRTNRQRQSLGIFSGLLLTEVVRRPLHNFKEVLPGPAGQSNSPKSAHDSLIALSDKVLRCTLSASGDSKRIERPASISATPPCMALRKAANRKASSSSRRSTSRNPSRKTSLAF